MALSLAACSADSNWPSYGRDNAEQRYSPLEDINPAAVGKLGLNAVYDMRDGHSVEATPMLMRSWLSLSMRRGFCRMRKVVVENTNKC